VNLKRDYGHPPVSENIPYHFEIYDNETLDEHAEVSFRTDRTLIAALDLPEQGAAFSRIWGFKKDPWQFHKSSGELLFSLERIKFSMIRAGDIADDIRCLTVLHFNWTDHYHPPEKSGDCNIPGVVRLIDSSGGDIHTWDLGKLHTGISRVRRPMTLLSEIDPRFADTICGAVWNLFIGWGRLYDS